MRFKKFVDLKPTLTSSSLQHEIHSFALFVAIVKRLCCGLGLQFRQNNQSEHISKGLLGIIFSIHPILKSNS